MNYSTWTCARLNRDYPKFLLDRFCKQPYVAPSLTYSDCGQNGHLQVANNWQHCMLREQDGGILTVQGYCFSPVRPPHQWHALPLLCLMWIILAIAACNEHNAGTGEVFYSFLIMDNIFPCFSFSLVYLALKWLQNGFTWLLQATAQGVSLPSYYIAPHPDNIAPP